MLSVWLKKYRLNALGVLCFLPGVLFAAGQVVLQVDLTEDDASVYPNFLYAAGVLSNPEAYTETILFGNYGYFFLNDKGSWAFITEQNRKEIQQLGAGMQLRDQFTVNDVDGGASSVVVTIKGVNDRAEISGTSAGVVWEDKVDRNNVLRASGRLIVNDVDAGEALFVESMVAGRYGNLKINDAGFWIYRAENNLSAIQSLAKDSSLTESFVVNSRDMTEHEIVVTIRGVNDSATVSGSDTGVVIEDNEGVYKGYLQTGGQLEVLDRDSDESRIIEKFVVGDHGYFYINDSGEWGYLGVNNRSEIQSLSKGDFLEESFTVRTVDGTGHVVSVKILGADEVVARDSIRLTWQAPFERENGQPLSPSEIAGYHVYYGHQSGHYIYDRKISNEMGQPFVLSDLVAGTYYIVVTTYDIDGRESEYSKELVVSVGQ